MDTVSKSQRSYNMSRIKSKDTGPEMTVRKKLFSRGLRYRLHVKTLPGKPDLVVKKYKVIVDVRGCFWHGHKNCKYSSQPKSNSQYWTEKIDKNKDRDHKNTQKWKELGFNVFTIWECETKNDGALSLIIDKIMNSKNKQPIFR